MALKSALDPMMISNDRVIETRENQASIFGGLQLRARSVITFLGLPFLLQALDIEI